MRRTHRHHPRSTTTARGSITRDRRLTLTVDRQHTRVFVYGTLLQGEPNHPLLARARFVGEARTAPRFSLVDLGAFPAMVPGGETSVHGEIYEVDPDTLAALDRLEGHPTFYQRSLIRLDDGAEVVTYLMRRERVVGELVIDDGDWRAQVAREERRCG